LNLNDNRLNENKPAFSNPFNANRVKNKIDDSYLTRFLKKKDVLSSYVLFTVPKPEKGNIRLVFQFLDSNNKPVKVNGGASPNGKFMDKVLQISVKSGNQQLPVLLSYNVQIWSGLNWAIGEIEEKDLKSATQNMEVTFEILDGNFKGDIKVECYNTIYTL